MEITRNTDEMARTAQEMAEAQRDSYGASRRTSRRPSAGAWGSPKAGWSS